METGPNIITKELGWVLEKSKIERNVDRSVGRREAGGGGGTGWAITGDWSHQ